MDQRHDNVGLAILVALYLLALVARLPFLSIPMYGDEAVQYTMARHWGNYESRGQELTTGQHVEYGLVFWQRPAFPVLLSPGALFGVGGMRMELLLLTSLFAPLGFEALRRMNVSLPWAFAGGAAVAVHPILTLWGTRVFPDALAAVFLLAALVADQHRRFPMAAGFLVLSSWSKEVVLPAVLGVAVLRTIAWLRAHRRGQGDDWRPAALYGTASLVGALPLLFVLSQGARAPGWTFSGEYMVARLVVGMWTIPLLFFVLMRHPWRPLPWLAVGFPALFIADHFVRNTTIEEWYFVLPNLFVLLAVPAALDRLLQPVFQRLRNTRPRSAPLLTGCLVVMLVLVPVAASPRVVNLGFAPTTRQAASYVETLDAARLENADFPPTVARVRAELPGRIVLVNPAWYNIEYPWAEIAHEVRYVYTPIEETDAWPYDALDEQMRKPNTFTVFHRLHPIGPVFEELERRYAECKIHDAPNYFVVRANDCPRPNEESPLLPIG